MSILTCNLKHFCQRRWLWVWNVPIIVGTFVWLGMVLYSWRSEGEFLGYLILSFVIGFIAGALQRDTLVTPFTYCLPGHRQIPRRLLVWVGCAFNFPASLTFAMYPDMTPAHLPFVICSAFVLGMAAFLLGAFTVIPSGGKVPGLVALLPLLVIAVVSRGSYLELEYIVVFSPVLTTVVGLIACVAIWWHLGHFDLARRYCGKQTPMILGDWNVLKMRQYTERQKLQRLSKQNRPHSKRLEAFFLGRMDNCRVFGSGRYAWGAIYSALVTIRHSMLLRQFSILLLAVYVVYTGGNASEVTITNMLFLCPLITTNYVKLPIFSSMLFPAGRAERFWSSLLVTLVTTVFLVLLVMMLAVLSKAMEPILPNISWLGRTVAFRPMDITNSYAPVVVVPIGFLLQLVDRRGFFAMLGTGVIVGLGTVWLDALTSTGPIFITILAIITWSGFCWVLGHYCFRRCLVGQRQAT